MPKNESTLNCLMNGKSLSDLQNKIQEKEQMKDIQEFSNSVVHEVDPLLEQTMLN